MSLSEIPKGVTGKLLRIDHGEKLSVSAKMYVGTSLETRSFRDLETGYIRPKAPDA